MTRQKLSSFIDNNGTTVVVTIFVIMLVAWFTSMAENQGIKKEQENLNERLNRVETQIISREAFDMLWSDVKDIKRNNDTIKFRLERINVKLAR